MTVWANNVRNESCMRQMLSYGYNAGSMKWSWVGRRKFDAGFSASLVEQPEPDMNN